MLAAGTRLGAYEVVALIGAGGMGEVYRARDLRLGRDVALKVLPEAFAGDTDRLARFEREAHVLAALKHPGIASIYGLESRALVLELVEGETLADRLARGRLPLDEALPIAKQIADALEAAHEQGIVHRDLKPANIKVTPEGLVKVLDFGLAKLSAPESEGAGFGRPDATASPTITSPAMMTGIGTILGTAAYMAPEQAKGRPADRRSDMWAFGCVLYEMLTGRRLFPGEDAAETLADVIKGHVTLEALPAQTPPAIVRLLRRCLVKDRRGRLADAGAARLDIDEALTAPVSTPSRRGRTAVIAAAAVGAVVVALAVRAVPAPATTARPARFSVDLPPSTALAGNVNQRLSIAADGRFIAFVAVEGTTERIYVRPLDQLHAVPVRGAEGDLGSIFLSPDGEWIGYNDSDDGSFRKVRVTGGPPVTLTESGIRGGGGFRGATWGPTGTIVYATISSPGLMEVPDTGGTPQALTTTAEGELHRAPHFLPHGRAILFVTSKAGAPSQIAALPLDTREPKVLLEGESPRFATTGHLVFFREGALWAVAFDPDRLEVAGEAVPVLEDVGVNTQADTAFFDLAADGTLLYTPRSDVGTVRTLLWIDREGREEPVPAPPRTYVAARLSPDGTRIALDARDEEGDIWIWHLTRRTLTRATFGRAQDRFPFWSADGERLIFSTSRAGGDVVPYWQSADGTGEPQRLGTISVAMNPSGVTPDGRSVLLWSPRDGDLRVMPLDASAEPRPLLQTPYTERNAVVSPDGRWIAFESNASGTFEIYVRPFPNLAGGQWQVSTNGGTKPLWAHSGRELFYVGGTQSIMSVPVQDAASWSAGVPGDVVTAPFFTGSAVINQRTYDVSRDGRRFLVLRDQPLAAGGGPSLILVQHWFEELKRLVPTRSD